MGRKSEVKSGVNIGARILTKLAEAVQDMGGGDEDLRLIETDEYVRRDIAERLMHKPFVASRTVTVNGSRSLAEMIAAANYTTVDKDITDEHFPVLSETTVDVTIVTVSLPKDQHPSNAIWWLDKLGYRPATLAEQLALVGHDAFWLQLSLVRLVALGSTWLDEMTGMKYAVALEFIGRERHLRKVPLCWSLGRDCQFSAVKK